MKKLMIIMASVLLVGTASAQRGFREGGFSYSRPTVIVGGGYYPYYGLGLGFGPFYPYYPYGYGYNRPSKLGMQIQDIKNDYADKIYSVKQDSSLTRKERRMKIHELKVERDNAIDNLKRNYYKS